MFFSCDCLSLSNLEQRLHHVVGGFNLARSVSQPLSIHPYILVDFPPPDGLIVDISRSCDVRQLLVSSS